MTRVGFVQDGLLVGVRFEGLVLERVGTLVVGECGELFCCCSDFALGKGIGCVEWRD